MKVLVTGADGFVGSWLIPALEAAGHAVVAAVGRGAGAERRPWLAGREVRELELLDPTSIEAVAAAPVEAVVHLAAVASGRDARRDPQATWDVNVEGAERMARAVARAGARRLVFPSTAEVYGSGPQRPLVETDRTQPCSPYAESKLEAERRLLALGRETGLEVIVARSFPHTGRGQDTRFVVPAFARRLIEAKRTGERAVPVGNLTPVRDFLHVSDVVAAYLALLAAGEPGEIYNVASGRGLAIGEVFDVLARLVGHRAQPVPDPALVRAADVPYLVGDASKLTARTGWRPTVPLDHALREVVDAQTD